MNEGQEKEKRSGASRGRKSCPYYGGVPIKEVESECMIFALFWTKQTDCNRDVSIRRHSTVHCTCIRANLDGMIFAYNCYMQLVYVMSTT